MKTGAIVFAALLGLSPIAMTSDPAPTPTDSEVTAPTGATVDTRAADPPPADTVLGTTNYLERSAAPARSSRRAPSTHEFDWPTASETVLRKFDHLENNWDSGHRGVDIASTPGERIKAAGPGRVAYAGLVVDNNVVSIEHTTGLRTTYMPLTPSVDVGDYVDTGDVIGTIEEGHCLIGACLHWGAKRGDVYYDPLSLLNSVVIRLYPVGG